MCLSELKGGGSNAKLDVLDVSSLEEFRVGGIDERPLTSAIDLVKAVVVNCKRFTALQMVG